MSAERDPREGPTTCSVVKLLRSSEGGDAPVDAQAPAAGQERISERMWQVATRQVSAQAREERNRQTEEAAWLCAREECFFQQAAQAAVEEHQMQAMTDQGHRDESMNPAASERYADADVRECDPVRREGVETLERKRQDDLSRSASRSASLLITWAEHLPKPKPQPPPRATL